ncbi:MAG: hypothetical protein U9R29_05400 [Thermodesulfobacteriota bacterium]|nr:hypothetical protein [Thermodesulfobacteriota bacterium]
MRWLSPVALWLIVLPLFAHAANYASAASPDATLHGHLKSFSQLLQRSPNGQKSSQWLSFGQLRLQSTNEFNPTLIGTVAATYTALQRQHPDQLHNTTSANQHLDLTSTIGSNNHLLRQLEIDRLNLHWQWAEHEVIIGRQAVGFGRIGLYSPLDIIAPFAPIALITDVRPGIDALRWNYYFSPSSQLQTQVIFNKISHERSFLISLETLLDDVDLLAIGGTLGQRPMLGLAIAGQFAGIGIRAEAVSYRHQPTTRENADPHDKFTIAAIEADCRLPTGIYLAIEYLYNGSGSNKPKSYAQILSSSFYREQRAYLAAKHYLLTSLAYEWHPLVTISLFSIYNGDDHSLLIRPELDLSLTENLNLQLSYSSYYGNHSDKDVEVSEFGNQGDSFALYLSYFF